MVSFDRQKGGRPQKVANHIWPRAFINCITGVPYLLPGAQPCRLNNGGGMGRAINEQASPEPVPRERVGRPWIAEVGMPNSPPNRITFGSCNPARSFQAIRKADTRACPGLETLDIKSRGHFVLRPSSFLLALSPIFEGQTRWHQDST